jgi:hemerythrin-like metal-binding protein
VVIGLITVKSSSLKKRNATLQTSGEDFGREVMMAQNMVSHLAWTEKRETERETIDGWALQALATIDELSKASAAQRRSDEIERIMDFLMLFLAGHFQNEEEEMRQYRYPWYDEHVASHEEFWKSLDRYMVRLYTEDFEQETVDETVQWIAEWLEEHIQGENSNLAIYLAIDTLNNRFTL